jgi:hypothetical protein
MFGKGNEGEEQRRAREGRGEEPERSKKTHLSPTLLDKSNKAVEVGIERSQTRRIEQQAALGRSSRGSARRAPASMGQRRMLVVAQQLDLGGREAQLRVRDGRGRRAHGDGNGNGDGEDADAGVGGCECERGLAAAMI